MIPVPAPPGFDPLRTGQNPARPGTGLLEGIAAMVGEWIGTLALVALGAALVAYGVTRVFGIKPADIARRLAPV